MALPAKWVDELFARLGIRYGSAFIRQWADADPAIVKADWADVLGGFGGADIAYGLQNLPDSCPLTAMMFRSICRRAPAPPAAPRLDAPKPDPARVAELVANVGKPAGDGRTAAQRVADGLRKKLADGAKLTRSQIDQLAAIERMSSHWQEPDAGAFKPVPAAVLPKEMRGANLAEREKDAA